MACTQKAKQCVLRWYDKLYTDSATRSKLITGIDRIEKEINNRKDWYQVRSEGLVPEDSLDLRIEEKYYQSYPAKNRYVITTLCPNWKNGWEEILLDENVYNILTWFLHYSMQYIHLSYVTKVLLTATRHSHECMHPFGVDRYNHNYGPIRKFESSIESFNLMKAQWELPSGFEQLSIVKPDIHECNLLDPSLHEAAFFLHRAYSLYYRGFYQEAFVSLDCSVKSIGYLLQRIGVFNGSPSREKIGQYLNLSNEEVNMLDYTYFIRNNFGAHPGGWRWWHSYEYTNENQFEEVAELTFLLITRASALEHESSLIMADTDNWGNWLFDNFQVLWNAVWHEKYSKWAMAIT